MSWTALAEYATDTEEIAGDIAISEARCYASGLDPRAYRGVVHAYMALGGRHVRKAPQWADDEHMLNTLGDQAQHLGTQLARIDALTLQIQEALKRARARLADARARIRRAEAAIEAAYDDIAAAGADDEARAVAEADLRAAQFALMRAENDAAQAEVEIRDCLRALAIIAEQRPRIQHAYTSLGRAPAEMGLTYEASYDLVARGGVHAYRGRYHHKS